MQILDKLKFVRSALYVPGSNARALEKARSLDADMLIIDLEDAVPEDMKAAARSAAVAHAAAEVNGKIIAIRANDVDSVHHAEDISALKGCDADLIVLPKVEDIGALTAVGAELGLPLLAMIETPAGLYAAREIAAHASVAGLIAGTNDIAAETGIKQGPMREGLELALQGIVLAASAAGKPRFDGVCNRLDDMTGFDAECRQGATYGFTGKTLIHPNQIDICNQAFGPDLATVAEARELIAASRGGAQRFKGRMIETMHVEEAKLTIERSRHATGDR
ncbi:MAG: CoA ester lyase [Sphingomonadaceae bacterium]|nr:CoA ester lyase [Sphingomonadaceae bacterium]